MGKISVIGAGNVGATIANDLMVQGVASEIVLIDVNKQKAKHWISIRVHLSILLLWFVQVTMPMRPVLISLLSPAALPESPV